MHTSSHSFIDNAHQALQNPTLQQALLGMEGGLAAKRRVAVQDWPEYQTYRQAAQAIKTHSLDHLDLYLERFIDAVEAAGGHVHWAEDANEAQEIILKLVKDSHRAQLSAPNTTQSSKPLVTKGKSMAAEEISLNQALEAHDIEVLETDLGEYIIQLRHEPPSHIIAPAIHILKEEVAQDFRDHHCDLPRERSLDTGSKIVAEARTILRSFYAKASVGITGANFLIAETGQAVIVTNEGNGDLSQNLARCHITIAGIEKIVPTLDDCSVFLRLLARSATGQELSVYTSFHSGPKRKLDADGPQSWHVVLLNNGRSKMLGGKFQAMLSCIRCGACMNVCPVYRSVGGHAYGWVYPGPMGSVLTPNFIGLAEAHHLPQASSLCGRCGEVCPVKIPLPSLLREWRSELHRQQLGPAMPRLLLKLWGLLASHPLMMQRISSLALLSLRLLGKQGWLPAWLIPKPWRRWREFPAPTGTSSFIRDYQRKRKSL